MKSIKEKSEEVFPIEEYDSFETELQRRKMRLSYEHGANYVLDVIEEFMKHNIVYEGNLKRLIEQLKK